ncbi:MAG: hypothetical protein ACOYT4_05120 [Nanoarchaeota archaeon]
MNIQSLGDSNRKNWNRIRDLSRELNNQSKETRKIPLDGKPINEITNKVMSIDERDFWRFMSFDCNLYVDLLKKPLENGETRKQDEWAEYSDNARKKGEFYTGSMQFYHLLFRIIIASNNQEALKLVKEQMQNSLLTLTRINYNYPGLDRVIHNYSMPDENSIKVNLVGPEEWIKNSADRDYLKALLNTTNVQEIDYTYHKMNLLGAWISRGKRKCSWKFL